MAQLSRPFQIALVALVLFVLVWFVALHRPGSKPASSSASSAASAPASAHAPDSHAASAHAVAHPGTAAQTHAGVSNTKTAHSSIKAAHSETSNGGHTASVGASHKAVAAPLHTQPTPRRPIPKRSAAATPAPRAPAMQAAVAAELKQGKVVLVLFWNSGSTDDKAVHSQIQAVAHKLGRSVVLHTATAGQVGSFGSITRDIQVYQTPTLLIVNRHAQVTTLSGYTDAYAIEQAIREARG